MQFLIGLLVFILNFIISNIASNFFVTDALNSFLYLIFFSQCFLSATIATCTFIVVKAIKSYKE